MAHVQDSLQVNKKHADKRPVTHSFVGKVPKRFRETGSLHDQWRSARPLARSDKKNSPTAFKHLRSDTIK